MPFASTMLLLISQKICVNVLAPTFSFKSSLSTEKRKWWLTQVTPALPGSFIYYLFKHYLMLPKNIFFTLKENVITYLGKYSYNRKFTTKIYTN